MTFLNVLILSLVEGVTEFLPISSTGHLIVVSRFLNLESTTFLTSFNLAIQLGAIGAVVVLYGRRLLRDKDLWKKVLVAFVPTGVIGLTLYKFIKGYLLGSVGVTAWALGLGGLGIILFEMWYKRHPKVRDDLKHLTYKQAWYLGLAQSVSIIPGVSRAGATILGGLALGLPRALVVEFSFLLAIPTLTAAVGYDLYKSAGVFSVGDWDWLFLGFIFSFAAAWVTIKWLLNFIKTHDFTVFGSYRVLIALLIWWLLLS
ncbi:MAG: undecaprenyl-diphosphatase UppP [bacterium]|nr:undecaprenyl-diphosphatase UppP [bacterium]